MEGAGFDQHVQEIGAIVAGGFGGELGGGKFQNGAATGSFVYMFNQAQNSGGSSGNDECSVETVCKLSQDQVALAALEQANPLSIAANVEYGGLMYQIDGVYHYTPPIQGTLDGFNLRDALPYLPEGAKITGFYHTHGDYTLAVRQGSTLFINRLSSGIFDSYNSDSFSAQDLRVAYALSGGEASYRAYLGTPSGQLKAYAPMQGLEYRLK